MNLNDIQGRLDESFLSRIILDSKSNAFYAVDEPWSL